MKVKILITPMTLDIKSIFEAVDRALGNQTPGASQIPTTPSQERLNTVESVLRQFGPMILPLILDRINSGENVTLKIDTKKVIEVVEAYKVLVSKIEALKEDIHAKANQ